MRALWVSCVLVAPGEQVVTRVDDDLPSLHPTGRVDVVGVGLGPDRRALEEPTRGRVDTLATWTVVAVMPVWSLNALCGIDELPPELPDAVVVDVAELVELQAVTSTAATATRPSAVIRLLHDAERKAPP